MPKVRLSGWKPGFKTVPAIKAIRQAAGIGLDEALAIVNQILDRRIVDIELTKNVDSARVAAGLTDLGMIVEVVRDSPLPPAK